MKTCKKCNEKKELCEFYKKHDTDEYMEAEKSIDTEDIEE